MVKTCKNCSLATLFFSQQVNTPGEGRQCHLLQQSHLQALDFPSRYNRKASVLATPKCPGSLVLASARPLPSFPRRLLYALSICWLKASTTKKGQNFSELRDHRVAPCSMAVRPARPTSASPVAVATPPWPGRPWRRFRRPGGCNPSPTGGPGRRSWRAKTRTRGFDVTAVPTAFRGRWRHVVFDLFF